MKKTILPALFCFLFGFTVANAQEKKTESFKVYGNCDMCKETIESSLKKKDGVLAKRWDKGKKEITVTYDPAKISIQQIAEKVANAGYDNQYVTAPDASYNKLHHCCQYQRPSTKKE